MTITLNGERRDAPEAATLADLLAGLGLVAGRLACEVNGRVIRRADYAATVLAEGDLVEVVQMIGGG